MHCQLREQRGVWEDWGQGGGPQGLTCADHRLQCAQSGPCINNIAVNIFAYRPVSILCAVFSELSPRSGCTHGCVYSFSIYLIHVGVKHFFISLLATCLFSYCKLSFCGICKESLR